MFGGSGARLVFGVISDIHLKNPGDDTYLLKALGYFRDRGADAVMVPGDTADTARICQMEMFADAWKRVFPGDKGLDGRHVEKLLVYGNHCVDAWTWNNPRARDKEFAAKDSLGYGKNRERVWEELFGEKYEPIWMKQVRGYTFIGAHWKNDNHVDLDKFMAKHGDGIDMSKPFFYVQHAHLKDTCFGSWAWGHDDGLSTRVLSKFPNAVAFSGHSHYTLTDERTVWQGAFTSVNASSLKYTSHDYSLRDNIGSVNSFGYRGEKGISKLKQHVPGLHNGKQGMLVSVYDDRIVIERREFTYGLSLGDDWVIPLGGGEKPYSYAEHAARRSAPEFPEGGKIAVEFIDIKKDKAGKCARLSFPRAGERGGCRVFEYEISAVLVEDDVDLVKLQRRFIAPDFFLPLEKKIDGCEFLVRLSDLPLKGKYRFRAVPIECFGGKGRPVWSDVVSC